MSKYPAQINDAPKAPVLVHPVLTDEQALLIHQALVARNTDPEVMSEEPDEEARLRQEMGDLTTFFSHMVEHPEDFRLRSNADNKRLIRSVKPRKGPAQPQSRKKLSQGQQKRTRKRKREEAEDWNRAAKIIRDEQLEAQEDFQREVEWRKARFETLVTKDTITGEEMAEALELFGAPEDIIGYIKEQQAKQDPQARIDAAAEAAQS